MGGWIPLLTGSPAVVGEGWFTEVFIIPIHKENHLSGDWFGLFHSYEIELELLCLLPHS